MRLVQLIANEAALYPKAFWISLATAATIFSLPYLIIPAQRRPIKPIRVAFTGNSITFVNDVPRLMEALSGNTLTQNSCLHGSLNLMSLMTRGNGMYKKWSTENAKLNISGNDDDDNNNNKDDGSSALYDYGACTFPQLIFGHDENLSANNNNSVYINDDKNPCFSDAAYYDYLQEQYAINGPPKWDYVVMNDQTKYPAIFRKRRRSLLVLKEVYSQIFYEANARPVFIATHGYKVYNFTELGDVPEFTSHLWYGYHLYAKEIGSRLPSHLQPMIVPSGLAFLTIYEEDMEMYKLLFYVDGYHPSVLGTYLMTCCLFATIYGRMPDYQIAVPTDNNDSDESPLAILWERARAMATGDIEMPYPTVEQAAYLYNVAERVTLRKHRPASLWSNDRIRSVEVEGSWYNIDGTRR